MMKSVFARLARAPSARHFSSYPKGRRFSSSLSPKDNAEMPARSGYIKTVVVPWLRRTNEVVKKVACGASGIASGAVVTAVILPNHRKPYFDELQENIALIETTQELIMEFDEKLRMLEEEGV